MLNNKNIKNIYYIFFWQPLINVPLGRLKSEFVSTITFKIFGAVELDAFAANADTFP